MALPVLKTVEDAAKYLETSPRSVYAAIASGDLRARRIGKRYAITEEALADYVNATHTPSTGRPEAATGRRMRRSA